MLTLVQLQRLMRLNDLLTIKELRRKDKSNFKRLLELNLHRSMIKDCIIEVMSKSSSNTDKLKLVS